MASETEGSHFHSPSCTSEPVRRESVLPGWFMTSKDQGQDVAFPPFHQCTTPIIHFVSLKVSTITWFFLLHSDLFKHAFKIQKVEGCNQFVGYKTRCRAQILMTVFKVNKSLRTWHTKPTSKKRCGQKRLCRHLMSLHLGQKVDLEHMGKTTANVQLECMLCACVRWNTSRWKKSRCYQSKCCFVYGLYIYSPSFSFSFWMTHVDYCRDSQFWPSWSTILQSLALTLIKLTCL